MEILKDARESEITRSITENFYLSWYNALKSYGFESPKALFNIDGFISGVPYMMFNSLFDGYDGISQTEVEEVIQYFKSNRIPLMWLIGPDGVDLGIDKMLEDLGIELATMQVPGMFVDLNTVESSILEEKISAVTLRLLDVSNSQELEEYSKIFLIAFNVDPSYEKQMKSFSKDFARFPDSSHYVIIEDNRPVACASVIYCAGVAGIYNVATLPEYQRRGFGSALMAALMKEAKEKGFQYSILHSSENGKIVYERLGYQVQFWFKRYLLRPKDVGL